MNYQTRIISGLEAKKICAAIIESLPQYFGIAESNLYYINGVENFINIIALENDKVVGLICLDQNYPQNMSVFWMGVYPQFQRQGVGAILIEEAVKYCTNIEIKTLTVETLAPSEKDVNYLKTYKFYAKQNFQPILSIKPQGYKWDMVYMVKILPTNLENLMVIEKNARAYGFDWPNIEMILDQCISEVDEVKEAIFKKEGEARIQEEIGDLMHTAISICMFANFDVEETFSKAFKKFQRRMNALKEIATQHGFITLKGQSMDVMLKLWNEVKNNENSENSENKN